MSMWLKCKLCGRDFTLSVPDPEKISRASAVCFKCWKGLTRQEKGDVIKSLRKDNDNG